MGRGGPALVFIAHHISYMHEDYCQAEGAEGVTRVRVGHGTHFALLCLDRERNRNPERAVIRRRCMFRVTAYAG